MPASWRSSTGDDPLDEIRALAGTDRMTIPPPLLEALAACEAPLERALTPALASGERDRHLRRDGGATFECVCCCSLSY